MCRIRTASVAVIQALLAAGADINSLTTANDENKCGVSPLTLVLLCAARGTEAASVGYNQRHLSVSASTHSMLRGKGNNFLSAAKDDLMIEAENGLSELTTSASRMWIRVVETLLSSGAYRDWNIFIF